MHCLASLLLLLLWLLVLSIYCSIHQVLVRLAADPVFSGQMRPFIVFVKGTLDYLRGLTDNQIRKLYKVICLLCTVDMRSEVAATQAAGDADTDAAGAGRGVEVESGPELDEIYIILRKQLTHPYLAYRRIGVMGAIQLLQVLAYPPSSVLAAAMRRRPMVPGMGGVDAQAMSMSAAGTFSQSSTANPATAQARLQAQTQDSKTCYFERQVGHMNHTHPLVNHLPLPINAHPLGNRESIWGII